MSRQIDPSQELTEDEVAYLEDRGWQHVLDLNAMLLMGGGADESAVEQAESDSEETGDDTGSEESAGSDTGEQGGSEEQSSEQSSDE